MSDIPDHSPVDAIDWVDYTAPTTIRVFFAAGGVRMEDTYDGVANGQFIAVGWNDTEKAAAQAAFDSYAAVANVHFQVVTSIADADFVLAKNPGTRGTFIEQNDGYWDVGGASLFYAGNTYHVQGVGVFNTDSDGDGQVGDPDDFWHDDALQPGGFAYAVLLHELGHGLGLAHPHDTGGGSQIMDGVTAPNITGDFELNQGIYTIMTYNDGWPFMPDVDMWLPGRDTWTYGWQASPMALDIAALQRKYGANTDHNGGDDTYLLPDDNAAGTGFRAIWDTGGTDTIRYDGDKDVTISLQAATLAYSWTGGGDPSYTESGIRGGFTIAAGVVIENAMGGSGDDWLRGNDAPNILDGRDGDDSVDYYWTDKNLEVTLDRNADAIVYVDGVAEDTLRSIEQIVGGNGNDTLTGDSGDNWINGTYGDDVLDGGDGTDWISFRERDEDIRVTLDGANTTWTVIDGRNEDQIRNFENVKAGWGDDALTGDAGDNVLWGMAGDDTLRGGAGKDTLDGGDGDNDVADFSDRTAGIALTLNGGHAIDVSVGGVTEDQLRNIEDIIGTAYADTITGDSRNNRFRGLGGRDVIDGGGGKLDIADYSDKSLGIAVHLDTSHFVDVRVGGVREDRLANIEGVVGTGKVDTLTGDSRDNFFRSMGGRDVLDGGAGQDTADYADKAKSVSVILDGSRQVSVYVDDHADDRLRNVENINGGSGRDWLYGDSENNFFQGAAGRDTLTGNAGYDTLAGGWDNDTLTGGSGNDRFQFTASLDRAGIDTIKDFSHHHDRIALDNDVMWALGDKTGTLSASRFYAHYGATHGHDSSDRVVYDTHAGKLYYDANGNAAGGVTQIAVLSGHPTLSADDFVIV